MAAAIKNAFKVAVIIDSCKTAEISHSVLAVRQQLSDHMLHSKTLQSHSQKRAADVSLWRLRTPRKCLTKNFVCMVFMQGTPFKFEMRATKWDQLEVVFAESLWFTLRCFCGGANPRRFFGSFIPFVLKLWRRLRLLFMQTSWPWSGTKLQTRGCTAATWRLILGWVS